MITACGSRRNNTTNEIFNLDQFITGQVEYLAKNQAELEKQSGFGDTEEIVTLRHDSAAWAKELSLFRTADIHKPGLRSFYEQEEYESGGDLVTEYELSDSTQSETINLRIIRSKETGNIVKIEALQHTRNPIYNSRRKLMMKFLPARDIEVRLDSFSVTGFQKMVIQDSVTYQSSGKILLTD